MPANYDGPGAREQSQLQVTRNLIAWDHQTIVINRPPALVRQTDGSMKRSSGAATTLDPQILFFSGVTADDVRMVSWQGEKINSNFILIGMPEADFQERDTFELWERSWTVVEVHKDTRWQKKAWVIDRAG